jgi:DNA (cytosine-5)-methyltransferase 1
MLDRAAEQVFGARTVWVSDIDKGACKVLAHRYPHAPNLGDITAVDWANVPRVDIITGGSPCQDLSHAGRRAGMTDGTRSNLWVSMREAIATLKPTYVLWENVHGALSAEAASELEHCPGCMGDPRHGGPVLRALGRVLGDLADLGFDAEWVGLRAADVGACHGRFRVFVLAYANGARLQGQPDPQGAAPAERHGHPVASAGRPDVALLPTPTASDTNGPGAHGTGGTDLRTAVQLLPTPLVGSSSPAAHGQISGQWRAAMADALTRWGEYGAAIARHEQAWGVPAPEPTEPGPKGNPRLSARFVEWMMMQPAGWVTDVPGVTRNEALKMLGNGVVTPQAVAALRVMLARIGPTNRDHLEDQ